MARKRQVQKKSGCLTAFVWVFLIIVLLSALTPSQNGSMTGNDSSSPTNTESTISSSTTVDTKESADTSTNQEESTEESGSKGSGSIMSAIIIIAIIYGICKAISAAVATAKERKRQAEMARQRAEAERMRREWREQQQRAKEETQRMIALEREQIRRRKEQEQLAIEAERKRRLQQEEKERQLRWADVERDFSSLDDMEGHEFEHWCADLLKYSGFTQIQVTPGSGDQGVDIIAWKDNEKYAIQCKRYSKTLGNKPIQEVNTGRTIYGCSKAAVITNQDFTQGAKSAAEAVGVLLWGRETLAEMIRRKNAALGRDEHNRDVSSGKPHSPALPTNAWKCPRCGMINTSKFCSECGARNPNGDPTVTAPTMMQVSPSKETACAGSDEYEVYGVQDQSVSPQKSTWFEQALKAANDYLSCGTYSRHELIETLQDDGFSDDEAQYAADSCGVNWQEQAKTEIQSYLKENGYSRSGLIEQLVYDGYEQEEAEMAVDACNVMWQYQAYRVAKDYLSSGTYSKKALIEQLAEDGFTHEEALYAADRV